MAWIGKKRAVPSCTIVLLLLLLSVSSLSGAEPADFSIEWVDSSAFPITTIYYSTYDESGDPSKALWVPDRVSVWENGVEHRSGGFEDGEHAPAYLSLIIDSSGSMEKSLAEVLDAARKLIEQFDYNDRAEIVDFDSQVVTRRSFTDNKDEMRGALEGISVGGGTALFDAIATGFDHLKRKEGMKTVLVLSDGEDENSTQYDFPALKRRLENEGVRVFTIALGEGVDTGTMTQIAELTEGSFYHADTADDVEGIYKKVITYLHSLHRMWYSTSFGAFDGSERTLTVESEETGTRHSATYTAPEGEYWSHAIFPRMEKRAAPIKISPDGRYVSQLQYRALINSDGRRLIRGRWQERYDGMMTEHFVCGWVHRDYGFLERYDPEEQTYELIEDLEIVPDDAGGDFHSDWVWRPKAISPNERYLVMCARPAEELEYEYYFGVYDREGERMLWERGFYDADIDEPGPAAVADDGTAAIVQARSLYLTEPDGQLRYSLISRENGRHWDRMSMDSDATYILGRDTTDDKVWLYSGDGELLWERPSRSNEQAGYLAVSPNGRYLAYADLQGPHVLDPEGNVLFELEGPEDLYFGNGIDIANNGAFVYSLGNRIYYRRLEE
jgi:uncharacterized protein YegL